MFLLDTNILSEFRKFHSGRESPFVYQWSKTIDLHQTFISVITLAEIKQGILSLQRKDPKQALILDTWFQQRILAEYQERILPISPQIALTCVELHVPNKKPINDAWIASTAIQHNLTLVTRNVQDFEHIPVRLLNPFVP